MTEGHADTYVPDPGPDGLRHWAVAGGVVRNNVGEVLLVENRRRNGELDWSTPGGVIDPGESSTSGLTREVAEETGLRIEGWSGPLYRIEVIAPGFGFFLRVEAYEATGYTGSLVIDDPDEIVVAADFFAHDDAIARLVDAPRWVSEPLSEQLRDGVADGRLYSYDLLGSSRADQRVTRTA